MTQTENIIATARVDGSVITIVERTHRLTGKPIFVVEEAAMGYLSTWDIKDTEAAARESANRLWTRRAGRETMIVCS